jgi:hypothetical protein
MLLFLAYRFRSLFMEHSVTAVWIAAEPSREIRLDDVLSAIRFSTMTVHELKEASKNPTANKSSSFHSILLKVLLGHYEAAAPRVLTRPEVVLSSTSEGPTPFVLNGRVFNVLLSHVSGRRSGIYVTVSGSAESKISGVFLLPYARQKDGLWSSDLPGVSWS